MFKKQDPESFLEKSLEKVASHVSRLRYLKQKLDQTSEPYARKSLSDAIRKEAEESGKTVKEYIESGGDPRKVAELHTLTAALNTKPDGSG